MAKGNINALIVGANQGIGLGFVTNLLQDSGINKIYATYRQDNAALVDLTNKYPEQLQLLEMDITQEEQIAKATSLMQSEIKELHLVVNCVGFLHTDEIQPEKSLKHINLENLLSYFQINSIGSVLLAKHLLPLFRHKQRSVFAVLSAKVGSIGDNALGGWYGYRASKSALNMFMRNVAIEYKRTSPETIIAMLHPGTTNTRLSQPFQKNLPPEKLFPVERTVSQLLQVIDKLQPEDSGEFFSWDGSRLPW